MGNFTIFLSFYVKALFSTKKVIFAIILIPILFISGIGLIGSQLFQQESRVQRFQVAIVNEDPTFETKMVIKQLTDNDHLNQLMETIQTNQTHADELLNKNEIAGVIYIPKGFSGNVAHGENTPVQVVGNQRRPLQSQLIHYLLKSAADLTSAAQSGINTVNDFMVENDFPKDVRKKELRKNIVTYALHVLGRGQVFEEVKKASLFQEDILQYYAISFFILLLMIWGFCGQLLLSSRINQSVSLRLLSYGITPNQIIAAKFVALFLLVMGCSLIIGIPMIIWMELAPWSFVFGSILISLVFSLFFLMLESLFQREKVFLLLGVISILVGAIVGGHLIPTVYYPSWLEQMSSYSVNAWALTFMLEIFHGEWTSSLSHSFKLLLLSSCGFLFISILLNARKRRFL
ncbi:ABC transporter permease [Heyndrickxia oleronia]|uniref:ABC transporter permease n=1 Tax=Heyndrickxia oleronia TaxID=38875 RepID=UPI00374FE2FA